MWTIAAEAAATTIGIDPTIAFGALITGGVALIGSIATVMFSMSKHADQRVDASSQQSIDRIALELQESRGETLAAEKGQDLWREKAMRSEIEKAEQVAKLQAQVDHLTRENRRLKAQQ